MTLKIFDFKMQGKEACYKAELVCGAYYVTCRSIIQPGMYYEVADVEGRIQSKTWNLVLIDEKPEKPIYTNAEMANVLGQLKAIQKILNGN